MLSRISSTALHDLALVDGRERSVVELHHPLVVFGRVLVFVVQLWTAVGKRTKLARCASRFSRSVTVPVVGVYILACREKISLNRG